VAYQKIRQLILNSVLPPGAVVSERMLAERLEMGKAPIRAALIRLASSGLVAIASRQGIVISTPSIQDIIELYQMRVPLELLNVRQIAGKLRDDQIARLQANLEEYRRLAETGPPVDSVVVDFDFHRLLCAFHGNRQLARALDHIFDSLYREIRLAQAWFPERIRISAEEHRAVADAVIAGDADRAEDLMRAHLRFGEQFVLSRGSTAYGSRGND
jgi:DNA-binding GntR family transcriptional regulator